MADIKIIRASQGVYVPHDPENPDKNSMRLIPKGSLAMVPASFELPKGFYLELGKFKINTPKDKQEN